MKYVLKVWLYGGLANDYVQPLSDVTICLHSRCNSETFSRDLAPHPGVPVNQEKELPIRNNFPVAKGTTDEQGRIVLVLNDGYVGGAVDVGILVTKPCQEKDHFVYLTTLMPLWNIHGKAYIGAWNYCLMPRSSHQVGISPVTGFPRGLSPAKAGRQTRTSVPAPGVE